jgi:hypothetical protein
MGAVLWDERDLDETHAKARATCRQFRSEQPAEIVRWAADWT